MFGLSNQLLMGLGFGIFIGLVIGNKKFRDAVMRLLDGLMKSGKPKNSNKDNRICPHCRKPLE